MSVAGRLLTFFPTFILACAAGTVVAMIVTRSPLWLLAMLFCVYGVPLLTFRAIDVIRPLREGRSYLDGPRYSPWWGSHNIQRIYIAFPQLESLLQLIPGAFSLWLRLWGSRIGRRVHWTPRVEIADRSLLEVGDDVVFGHLTACYAHLIKRRDSGLVLYVRRIRVGDRVLLGAGSRLGPGARIASGATLDVLTDVGVGRRVDGEA